MAFIAVILVTSSLALYFYIDKVMGESVELRLFNLADNLLLDIAKNPDHFKKHPSDFLFSSSPNEFTSSGVLVEFIDPDGKVLSRSPGLKYQFLPFNKNEDDVIKDIEMEDGTELKVYQRMIEVEGEKFGYLVVGAPTSQMYHTLTRIREMLAILMLCAIVIMGFGLNAIVSADAINNQRKFLSFVSHELRTPLAVISGHAEVALRERTNDPLLKESLTTIKEESDWMNRMVSNLLLIFRSRRGIQKLDKTVFNLGEMLADCSSSIKKIYPGKIITLNLPEEAEIKADADQIKRLITNLIENAAKNTPPDGRIDVSLDSKPKTFILKVTDNGTGINKEFQKKIFDAFYQVEKENKAGVGLGLAISKWIVDAHRGKIEVRSDPGKGSEFTVTLPRR